MTTSTLYRANRFYFEGRKRYGLKASDAMAYARDRQTLSASELEWTCEPDTDAPGAVIVYLVDSERAGAMGEVLEALGAVEIDFYVSDHGNTNYDLDEPYLVGIVADMMRNYERVTT